MRERPNGFLFRGGALLAVVALGGCLQVPPYRAPAGFSSSYRRYLLQHQGAILPAEPALPASPSGETYERTDGPVPPPPPPNFAPPRRHFNEDVPPPEPPEEADVP